MRAPKQRSSPRLNLFSGVCRRCSGSIGSHADCLGSKQSGRDPDYLQDYCAECFPGIKAESEVARRVNPIGHPLPASEVKQVAKTSYQYSYRRDTPDEGELAARERFWRAHSSGLLGFLKAQVRGGASSCIHHPPKCSAPLPSTGCARSVTELD